MFNHPNPYKEGLIQRDITQNLKIKKIINSNCKILQNNPDKGWTLRDKLKKILLIPLVHL
mgnify:FL=1|jgi:hypothetical protein|tara:strand:+ start:622 stop:801 length:180 start_codon:yes stop_codon:yes gene_type:complete